ncbi:MAG: Bro-N domain-containing protein [Paludibacteraceae bacterium]|nr:Bro-N domain-containing protein [Paludibacteraceae bacterium]
MSQELMIKLFDERQVRVVWDEEQEKYFFSVVDVVEVLTDSPNPRKYWSVLKTRLKKEGSELATNCSQLKMPAADGKKYLTDVADTEQVLRIIQSIPSKKAEPLKRWLAEVGSQRLEQMQDPEKSIEQAIHDYRRLGYSEAWINQRVRSIEVRKELTDEWKRGGVEEGVQFASLTDILTKAWSGKTTKEYKQLKGLRKESLRDNMTNVELALNTLAEASAAELSKQRNPKGFKENARVAGESGDVAKVARQQLEQSLGRPVVTGQKASDYIHPIEDAEAKVLPKRKKKDKN